jgi:NAD(P)-dependent dehydrogenase (short-subunit alcohol dehydrogenase family)
MTPAGGEHLLVFGASGAIGQAVSQAALDRGWRVTGVTRSPTTAMPQGVTRIALDPDIMDTSCLSIAAPYTGVCWAQGANCNDSVYDLDLNTHARIYQANVTYILITLKALLNGGLFAPRARLCIISSIWQNLARQSKLSYCVSKAALQGLVLSAAADLAADGFLINAVLPGALDTPMTRSNLTPAQLNNITAATGFDRLPSLADVASLVLFLCSAQNTGTTGQFIAADLGFSHVRIV